MVHTQHCGVNGTVEKMPDIERARRRRRERVVIDGRLVAPNAGRHGLYTTYGNWSCRCKPCTDAHAAEVARKRLERVATLELVDDHLVAVRAKGHGSVNTYNNWGCRCEPCTEAARIDYSRRNRARRSS